MVAKHEFWSRVFTFVPTPLEEDGEAIDEDGLLPRARPPDREPRGRGLRVRLDRRQRLVLGGRDEAGHRGRGAARRRTDRGDRRHRGAHDVRLHAAVAARGSRGLRRGDDPADDLLAADAGRGAGALRAGRRCDRPADLRLQQPVDHRHRHAARVPRRARAAREHALRQGEHRRSDTDQPDPRAHGGRGRDRRRVGVDQPPGVQRGRDRLGAGGDQFPARRRDGVLPRRGLRRRRGHRPARSGTGCSRSAT